MRLEELFNTEFGQKTFDHEGVLRGENLKLLLPVIKECNEFKDKEITILNTPYGTLPYKVREEVRMSNSIEIYSIEKTPEIFDNDLMKVLKESVANEAVITPVVFAEGILEPIRSIILSFSVEALSFSLNERLRLHKLLDNVLNDIGKYKAKGKVGIIIRGKL